MSGRALALAPGARLIYDGDLVEVVELDGARVVVRNCRTAAFAAVKLGRLAAGARPADVPPAADGERALAVAWNGLTGAQRAAVSERAGHVREVLTGFRAGHAEAAAAGEPRPQYGPGKPLKARYQAKAAELGVGERTVERWAMAYRQAGEAGLVDTRMLRGKATAVDPRWDEAVRLVLAEMVSDSTPTRSAVLRKAGARLDELHGAGVVPRPSAATAYRRLAELARGTNAVSGSAKGRRSIADRPRGAYGRLRAMRPGEYAILDTQDLDVFAMEPVTCRWVRAQLTVVQDLFTRCITGLRVTPVSTKAVDVAGVLYQAIVPRPAPQDWTEQACWAYHGVPQQLVFTEEGRLPGMPVCPPKTLVVDHGKAFLSAHVIGVCTRLGISIQPAQPKKPTDKPTRLGRRLAARAPRGRSGLPGPGRGLPEGIRTGAPQAIQVADRFHLWNNLCEATEKTVAAHHHCLRTAAAAQAGPAAPEPPAPVPLPAAEPAAPPGRAYRLAERTRTRYAEVQECLARGFSRAAVSRELNLDIQTVRRFANAACAEELLGKAEHRATKLDPYIDLVNQRWNEGVTSAEAITAELRGLGFNGDAQTVRRYLRPFRLPGTSRSHPDRHRRKPAPAAPAVPKPRTISRALLTHPDHLTEDDALIVKNATAGCAHLERLQQHVRSFAKIMAQRRGRELPTWLDTVEADDLPELRSLAAGMRRDLPAIINGLTLEHSSGAVEGNVTRIKRIKRDGYGRANFDLLRAQILIAA